jgi:MFS family permease
MNKTTIVFWSACLGMLLFGIGLITLGAIHPFLRINYQLDDASSGVLFSLLPIGIMLGSLLFGPISDLFGYKILMIVSCLLFFFGILGLAHAHSIGALKFHILIFGLSGGALNGATNAVVADISSNEKTARLSLLGVFFAVGSLGMPFLLAFFEKSYTSDQIITGISLLPLMAAVLYLFVPFPSPKQPNGFPITKSLALVKDRVILLIAMFLFFQSSLEGLINNWTVIFLKEKIHVENSSALYALSLYVTGMALMRLVMGLAWKKAKPAHLLSSCFLLLLVGLTLMKTGPFAWSAAGMVLIGAGSAAGFPLMFSFVGNRYAELSATAFSFVLSVSLLGNMSMNVVMGRIAQTYGISYLSNCLYGIVAVMAVSAFLILRTINQPTNN